MNVKCMILFSPCCCTFEKPARPHVWVINTWSNALSSHDKRREMIFQP